ncbi:hypothetical protein VTJ49DRAFT_6596 [Mycothermus thermophilus]|uniref:Nephrocystin 3-like N-terminal domain-containing protein n=1 Tax=Humicola insolens TaxID=85995 RepID=A0ABR3VK70_HUMIN
MGLERVSKASQLPDRSSQTLIDVLHDVETVDSSVLSYISRWQDVLDAIEAAKSQDGAKAENNVLRAGLRKAGPEIAVLESLSNMIPDQDGLGALRGGLTTLFKLINWRLDTRAKILGAFETIPETFVDAVDAFMRFPDDAALLQAVRELYETLIDKVAVLIAVLLRSHPQRNKLARLWKQLPSREAEVVRNALDDVARAAERVKQCSTAALERTVGKIEFDVREVKDGVHNIQKTLTSGVAWLESRQEEHFRVVEENSRKMVEAAVILKGMMESREPAWTGQNYQGLVVSQHHATSQWLHLTATITPGITASPALLAVDPTVIDPHTPRMVAVQSLLPIDATGLEPLTPPATPASKSLKEVLSVLDVPDGADEEVLERVSRRANQLKADAGRWSARLMDMSAFRSWLAAPAWVSDLVLVDGHCGPAAADRVSPMSAICASLVDVLMETGDHAGDGHPAVTVLFHFCGQHVGSRDPLRGPAGLVRSLVYQVAQQYGAGMEQMSAAHTVSLDFVDSQFLEALGTHDVAILCRLFSELVIRLDGSRPIFCIIDGVTELETVLDGSRDEAILVITTLLNLVDQSRPGPALRVLLASAQRSAVLAESVIPPGRRLSLLSTQRQGPRPFPAFFEREVEELLMAGEVSVLESD